MPFRTHKNSGLEPLRTKRMTHSPAQMDDMGLVLQPIMGNSGKSISFHFTGMVMVPHPALLKLHKDLVKMQIH